MADYGDKKSARQKDRQRVKYMEDDESHSSDVRSDIDEIDIGPEEDIDHIDIVLDHRKGKQLFFISRRKLFKRVCVAYWASCGQV